MGTKREVKKACRSVPSQWYPGGEATRSRESERERERREKRRESERETEKQRNRESEGGGVGTHAGRMRGSGVLVSI